MKPYRHESGNPKYNAQRNLNGRTHYVDDDTLRFHYSRILKTVITDNGLLFALIESCAADMDNRRRVFRPVIFDIGGTVVSRLRIDAGLSTRLAAEKELWKQLNALDAIALTKEAIDREERNFNREISDARIYLESVIKKNAA